MTLICPAAPNLLLSCCYSCPAATAIFLAQLPYHSYYGSFVVAGSVTIAAVVTAGKAAITAVLIAGEPAMKAAMAAVVIAREAALAKRS